MILASIAVAVAVVILLIASRIERERRDVFEERFPPLTDAEFVARCAPGTRPEIALAVRRILSEALNVDEARIHPSARLVEDLGAE